MKYNNIVMERLISARSGLREGAIGGLTTEVDEKTGSLHGKIKKYERIPTKERP